MKLVSFFDSAACVLIDPLNHNFSKTKKTGACIATALAALCTLGMVHAVSALWRKLRKADESNDTHEAIKGIFHRVLHLKLQKISNGMGEFIVYKKTLGGAVEPLLEEDYFRVYDIMLQYAPSSFVGTSSKEDWVKQYARREEIILQEVHKIDPEIEITFIPRTLYELMLIHECIEEDLQAKYVCSWLSPMDQKIIRYPRVKLPLFDKLSGEEVHERQDMLKSYRRKNCWHLCYFDDAGDETLKEVKTIAFRLNKIATKKLGAHSGPLSYQKISELTENELEYLQEYYKNCKVSTFGGVSSCTTPGPTTNFGYESYRGDIKPMGIRHEEDARIIRNAIVLECGESAKKQLFIYRGAQFKKDNPFGSDKDKAYSLSYGSSLFAGAMYDGGATAYHYMRKNEEDAFAIKIPFEEFDESPFYVPLTHSVCQIFGNGEVFHSRTKVWKGVTSKPRGIRQGESRWEVLKSDIERGEYQERFNKCYKENVVFLK